MLAVSLAGLGLDWFGESTFLSGLLGGLIGLACIVILRLGYSKGGLLRAPVVYLVYFWFFNFGLAATYGFVRESTISESVRWTLARLEPPAGPAAAKMAALAAAAFAFGALLSRRPPADPVFAKTGDLMSERRLGLFIFVLGWLLFARWMMTAGGARALLLPYLDLRSSFAGSGAFPWALFLIPAGAFVWFSGASPSKWKTLGIPFIAAMTSLALVGLRSVGMVPLLILLVLYSRRGMKLPRFAVPVITISVLIAIPMINAWRTYGLSALDPRAVQVGITDAFFEMGSSLRPTAESYVWVSEGMPFLYGGSYWLPMERVVGRFVPMLRKPLQGDPRYLGEVVGERAGAIGFSNVAEAYLNFGRLGIVLFFTAMGFAVAWLDRTAGTPGGLARLGLLLLPILNNVRNTFIFVPGQILFGLIIVGILTEIGRRDGRIRRTCGRMTIPEDGNPGLKAGRLD